MKSRIIILSILVAGLGIAARAQTTSPSAKHASNYDPAREVTLSGTAERVIQQKGQGWQGTHIVMNTDSGAIEVHAGPADYLARNDFSFAPGDKLEVTGSRVTIQGKDVLLAREIKKDGRTLVLRNAQGVPNWSRRGRS